MKEVYAVFFLITSTLLGVIALPVKIFGESTTLFGTGLTILCVLFWCLAVATYITLLFTNKYESN